MAMVRQSIKMDEQRATTTKILNLYNKSADPGNKTGSVVLHTMLPGGEQGSQVMDMADFDENEITVIFEDEIETLYVGPVEISEEEENQRRLMEEAAAAKEREASRPGRHIVVNGSRKGASLLHPTASTSTSAGAGVPTRTVQVVKGRNAVASAAAGSAKLSSPGASNGSDSGIDNCTVRDDNKRKNTSQAAQPKDLKPKNPPVQRKLTDMVIKKRGRPPGTSTGTGQTPPKVLKAEAGAVKRQTVKQTMTPIAKKVVARAPVKATVSPKQQYECDLCEEVFSREDTIVDHYQSYHRVDPKKRSIKPRVNIPKEPSPEPEEELLEEETVEEQDEEEEEDYEQEEVLEEEVIDEEEAVVDVIQQDFDEAESAVENVVREEVVVQTRSPAKRVAVASPAATHSVKKEKKDKAPGLICGKCNLTFRTMLLLSRHINEMHDTKAEEDEDDEEEEEEEEEEEQMPQSPKKSRGKENHSAASSSAAAAALAALKKPRGRPRKSEETPRILNADKGILRIRLGAESGRRIKQEPEVGSSSGSSTSSDTSDASDASSDEEQGVLKQEVITPAKRSRKRKNSSFAEDDNENEVVPKMQQSRTRPRRQTQIQMQGPTTGDQGLIYVEVIDSKTGEFLSEGHEETVIDHDEHEHEEQTVYKIKDCTQVTKDGHPKFACPLCDMTFTRRYSLDPHIKRVHQKLRTKECPYCDRKFLATGDLTRHLTIHTGAKPYKCTIDGCPYRFVSRSDLHKHELRHTAGVPRTYVCGQCDKSFERPYDLKRHQMTHKDLVGHVDFKQFKCEHCDREFTRKDEYRAHMYRHLGLKPLKCHVCGKPFVDQSNCAKHCKGHGLVTHGGPKDRLSCGDCGQKFTNQSALSRHLSRCLHERSSLPVHTVPQFDYFEEDVK